MTAASQPQSVEPRTSFAFKKNWWPAPVTLVSCGVNEPGAQRGANISPFGVMGGPCDDPPILTFSPRRHLYSYRLIQQYDGEFVVNFPMPQMVREMEYCGTNSGIEVDKWAACGFTPVGGRHVRVPLIAECPVNFECKVIDEIEFTRDNGESGEQLMVTARILHVHAHEKYVINGELQWDLIDTIYRTRPGTWRVMGPVLGYDCRKTPLTKPAEAAELVAQRVATLEGLAEIIRQTPYPSQITTSRF